MFNIDNCSRFQVTVKNREGLTCRHSSLMTPNFEIEFTSPSFYIG